MKSFAWSIVSRIAINPSTYCRILPSHSKLWGTLLLGLAVLLSQGCAEERGITPAPTNYHAVLLTTDALVYQEYMIQILDLGTDSITGEIPIDVGATIPRGIALTRDGRYCAAFHGTGTVQVLDLQSLTVSHEMSLSRPEATSVHFLPDDSLKLFMSCRITCSSAVYDLSTGAVDTSLPGSRFGFSSPDQSELVAISSGGITRRMYDTWEIVDSFSFVSPLGGGVHASEAAVSSAYDGIYLMGEDASGGALFRYDLSDHSCTFRQPVWFRPPQALGRNSVAVSPDGREIWVLQPGGKYQSPPRENEYWGYILILDGLTGVPLDTIRDAEYWEQSPEYPLFLTAIEFHPDEPFAYVAAYSDSPSMVVIDRSTREIVGSFDVGYVREIVISPPRKTSGHY